MSVSDRDYCFSSGGHPLTMRTRIFAILALLAAAVHLHAACPDTPTFTPAHYAVDGVDPIVGFIRDVNGDGREDLVVFYDSTSGFQVFLGSATGVLTPTPVQFSPGFFTAGGSAPGDLNGDGKVDFAAGDIGSNTDIRLFYGVGNGTFTSGPNLPLPFNEGATALRVVDLDQDGLPDVVAVTIDSGSGGHFLFYRQTSPGTFSMTTVAPLPAESLDMQVADIDGDGKLDVAVVSAAATNVLNVFFGNGNGTFSTPGTVDLGAQFLVFVDSVAIHDFNFDGRLDLAVGIINRGIQIIRNDGNRTFSFAQLIPEPQGGAVRVADFNYDGVADLFASGYGGFYVVPANADGTFRTPRFTPIPEMNDRRSSFYQLGDVRGLHRVDVATATFFFPHPQWIEINLNDCGPPPLITSVTPSSGPAAGGNSVQLHGDNFFVPQQVLFGTTPATITASTPTLVTVTAPQHGPAIVPVSISTPDGTATLNNAYAFVGPTSTSVIVQPFIAASRPFNITAIVTPPPGGGTVTFSIDGNVLGTANVVGNSATITALAPSALGPHTIGAQFSGVPIFTPSSGSVVITVLADVPALSQTALAMLAAIMAIFGAIASRSAR